MLETTGWFLLGAGFSLLTIGIGIGVARYRRRRFRAYVHDLKEFGERLREMNEAAAAAQQETSELTFRDRHGDLCTVKIVIDYSLDQQLSEEDKEAMRQMIAAGECSGSLTNLIKTHKYSDMEKVQQFVFSGHAAYAMREQGLEPDDVVRQMLKASGRIA